ncbi:MAG: DUF427 domain-containing protein [Thermoleophilaceae bacterium]|nr:DUF427 domain-containing protein [Thermoleophilaceae bacterium]
MRAIWNGTTLAESDATVVVEGNHYFPPESVHWDRLEPTRMRSLCPWKGIARYYTVSAAGERSRNAAWSYRRPLPWIGKIRAHVAFWSGVDVRD